jgi:pyroglutamyl-peptidase
MTIILTGFEPFGTHTENPSRDIVAAVARAWDGTDKLVTQILPVEYDAAGAAITELMNRHRPRAVLMMGLGDSAPRPRLERVALNIDDADIADNAGIIRKGKPIRSGEPLALATPLDLNVLQSRLAQAGFASYVSNHAGAYICNHTYFEALRHGGGGDNACRCLFVHVPPSPTVPDEAEPHLHAMVRMTEMLIRMLAEQTVSHTKETS